MKKNSGFTLVELVAAITILAIIMVTAIPAVISIANNSKANMFCSKIETVQRAGQLYGEDNIEKLKDDSVKINSENGTPCKINGLNVSHCEQVTIKTLAENGYVTLEKDGDDVQREFYDPRKGKSMLNFYLYIFTLDDSNRVYAQYIYANKADAKRCTPTFKYRGAMVRNLYYIEGGVVKKEQTT